MSESPEERRWYLMLTDHEGSLDGLLGPIHNEASAKTLMEMMLATDQLMTDLIDWESTVTCAPYFYAHLKVIDLSASEVHALSKDEKEM